MVVLAIVSLLLLALVEAGSLVAIALVVAVAVLVAVVSSLVEAGSSVHGISGESSASLTLVVAAGITEVCEALVEAFAVAVATGAATSILVASGGSVEASESLVGSIRIVAVLAGIMGVRVVTSSMTEAAEVATLLESSAGLATVGFVATIGLFASVVGVSSEADAGVGAVTEAEVASLMTTEVTTVVTVVTLSSALELSGLAGHSKD